MAQKSMEKLLPLTEATFYILLALVTPKHGYAVMQEAEEISQGTLRLAPGTIYGALTTLEDSNLIAMVGADGRRKIYQVTDRGKEIGNFPLGLNSPFRTSTITSAPYSPGNHASITASK